VEPDGLSLDSRRDASNAGFCAFFLCDLCVPCGYSFKAQFPVSLFFPLSHHSNIPPFHTWGIGYKKFEPL
jgi:hypothetical protein